MTSKPIIVVTQDPEDDEAPHPYTSRPMGEVQPKKNTDEDYDNTRSWIVLAACFLSQAFVFGVALNFTVYFGPFLESFKETHHELSDSSVGLIGSLSYGVMFLIGPGASLLISRIGTMWAMILSGLLVSLGFLASRFASDVYFMYLSYGVLIGMGNGIAFLCGYAILNDYFRKYIRVATIVVSVGGGIGMCACTYIFQRCMDGYNGWRDSMLINAGLSLNLIALGLVMRPRPRDPSVRLPTFREMMAIDVVKPRKYQLFLFHVMLWNVGLAVVFVLLTDYLTPLVGKESAVQVTFYLGLVNAIGRVLSVPLERFFSPMKQYVVLTIVMGLFEALLPAGGGAAGFTVIGSALGGSFGIMICYFVPVVGELIGFNNVTPGLGYSNFAQGVGGLIGPPLLAQIAGGGKFVTGGILVIVSGVVVGVAAWLHGREAASNKPGPLSVENGSYDQHGGYERTATVAT